eukprot:Skav218108  [mRNA]  locus=scaffold759:96608:109183:- [translate_table: standard]
MAAIAVSLAPLGAPALAEPRRTAPSSRGGGDSALVRGGRNPPREWGATKGVLLRDFGLLEEVDAAVDRADRDVRIRDEEIVPLQKPTQVAPSLFRTVVIRHRLILAPFAMSLARENSSRVVDGGSRRKGESEEESEEETPARPPPPPPPPPVPDPLLSGVCKLMVPAFHDHQEAVF